MTKILVIEDTKSLREEIIETLGLEGFEVKGAENGAIGVEVAKQYQPDLVICDVMMPELDGYGTLAALQDYPPTATTPFIFLTAKADRVNMRHGMELGADDYLTKPFATAELLGAIAAQLKKIQVLKSQLETTIQAAIIKHDRAIQELRVLNDPLTNLPNRISFHQHLEEAILYAREHHCSLTLILIDIDDFNIVNNSLGHKIGDILFKAIAERLRRHASPCDPLARMQGDQFGLISIDRLNYEKLNPENLKKSAQKILEVLAKPYTIFGHEVFITACLGIAIYPQDHLELSGLVKNADMALYYAKSQGRNNYKFYSSNLNLQLSEQMAIENSLRRAFERKEFRLYYQPIVNSFTQDVMGVEALLRWQHPDLGIVLPDKFILLAETTGMISQITEWAIEQACKQLKLWQELKSGTEFRELYMAVNLSAYNFKQDNLVEMITRAIASSEVSYSHIELEITENSMIQSTKTTISDLSSLRQLGIKIAINDFGIGYSALGYIKNFQIDKLKIAKCFIQDILVDKHAAAITEAAIELAHSLNLGVVATGVETQEQLNYLQKHQCNLIQGFLFSPPLPAEQFTQLLVSGKRF